MKVAFGVTVLEKGLDGTGIDGIGRYTKELLPLLSNNMGISLEPYSFNRITSPNSTSVSIKGGLFRPQAAYSFITKKPFPVFSKSLTRSVDLVHATDHLIPKVEDKPIVATIMDAIPLSNPEWVNYNFRTVKNYLWRKSSDWAQRYITISNQSKADIAQNFRIPENLIDVVPLGVNKKWFDKPTASEVESVKIKYSLPEKCFLFVGTLQPRKNVLRLIEAYSHLSSKVRSQIPLVVVGRVGWSCQKEVKLLENGRAENIIWLRGVSDRELASIYSLSKALVFPSLYEGFGLPVLEAFAAKVPVITSNNSALIEVSDGCSVLVDPYSTRQITQAMMEVVSQCDDCRSLTDKALEKAKQFTWGRTASLTLDIYKKIVC